MELAGQEALSKGVTSFQDAGASFEEHSLVIDPTHPQFVWLSVDDQERVRAGELVYEDLGLDLKIVTLPTRRLANGGQGGIHCITMNYPPVPMQEMVERMGAKIIQ